MAEGNLITLMEKICAGHVVFLRINPFLLHWLHAGHEGTAPVPSWHVFTVVISVFIWTQSLDSL